MTRRFLFVLGSSRPDGNTELLARTAAEQLPAGTEQEWFNLAEQPLPDFVDVRHDAEVPRPKGPAAHLLEATLAATDLVIASPLYWYSVSAQTKRYLDHWAGWLRLPGVDFKARMAGRTLWASPRWRTRSSRSPIRWSAPCATRPRTSACGSAGCCSATAASPVTSARTPRRWPGEDLLRAGGTLRALPVRTLSRARAQVVMSFVVKRAQAAEPNTAT